MAEESLTERVLFLNTYLTMCYAMLTGLSLGKEIHPSLMETYEALSARMAGVNLQWELFFIGLDDKEAAPDGTPIFLNSLEESLEEVEEGLEARLTHSLKKLKELCVELSVECQKIWDAVFANKESPAESCIGPLDKALEHADAHAGILMNLDFKVKQAQWIKYRRGKEPHDLKHSDIVNWRLNEIATCPYCKKKMKRYFINKHGEECNVAAINLRLWRDREFRKWAADKLPPTPKWNIRARKDENTRGVNFDEETEVMDEAEIQKNNERNKSIVRCEFCKEEFMLRDLPRHQIMVRQCYLDRENYVRRLRIQWEKETGNVEIIESFHMRKSGYAF